VNDFALNIVLVWPEIPQNTGTIGRLCVATNSKLHLVKPLGFEIDEQRVRRAGLDYWKYVDLTVHEDLEAFMRILPPEDDQVFLIETKTKQTYFDAKFKKGSFLILGQETKGLPQPLMDRYAARVYSIPMWDTRVRSLNLSNATSIVTYEALRQLGA
jgi:tRNA (cytidine/uridine-2'-O-)-methyltransferase